MLRRWMFRGYYLWKKSGVASTFKRRRYARIIEALDIAAPARVLEVGCGHGTDFMRFATADGFNAEGVDLHAWDAVSAFKVTRADACKLPFPDRYFDASVSIGLFEHLQPMESLCAAAREIARVSKRYCVVIPSIGTVIEPHAFSLFWAVRDRNKKPPCTDPLVSLSDEGWLQFSGFQGATTERIWYMPGIQNLMIVGSHVA